MRFAPTTCDKIKSDSDDFGLMSYDPAFMNTASCKSAITVFIRQGQGDSALWPLCHRAARRGAASFLEVAWLLRNGELFKTRNGADHVSSIIHENGESKKRFLEGFRLRRAPECECCAARIAALSLILPGSHIIFNPGPASSSHPTAGEGPDAGGCVGIFLPAGKTRGLPLGLLQKTKRPVHVLENFLWNDPRSYERPKSRRTPCSRRQSR